MSDGTGQLESGLLLEGLFAHSADGVLLTRPDGTVLRANPAACRVLCRTEDEIRRLGRGGLVVDEPGVRRLLAEREATGVAAGVIRFRRPDGTDFPAEITSALIPLGGGAPHACTILRDVTERERAERALVAREALLRAVIDAVPDPLFLKDLGSRWQMANLATLRAVGKTEAEVLGRSDREIYADPRVGAALEANDARVMASGEAEIVEEEIQAPDGPRVYLSTKAPFRDEAGRVVGLVGHAQDVTVRRRAEELHALEDAIARLPIGMLVVEALPGGGARLVAGNEPYRRLVGEPPAPGAGLPLARHRYFRPDRTTEVPPHDWPGVRALRTGAGVAGLELHLLRPDGTWRVVSASAGPVHGRDRAGPPRAVTVLLDVTEERAARRELRALTARVQEVREVEMARIGRDLHDDLGQLLTALQLELRGVERLAEHLPATAEAGALLDRLLAASELAGSVEEAAQRLAQGLRPEALERLGLEAALAQELRSFERRSGLEVRAELAPGLRLAPAAATALFRIAQEALTNVARHAGARRVEVRLAAAGDQVVLEIGDDGRGLAPGDPEALHLGLSGMRERAWAVGGEAAVGGRAGGGTLVRATVPAAAEVRQ